MKLNVVNIEGASTGRSVDLPDSIFGGEPNDHAIYLAVKQYRLNQRQGTHKAKEKGEVTASTRKVKKQKGTGTARMGSLKSGILRGGGRMFGPRPRNYGIKLNKKVKRLARRSALATKAQNEGVVIIEDFTFDKPQTAGLKQVMKSLELADTKTLLVTGDYDTNVYLASRNLPKTNVMNVRDLNTYDIMNAKKVLIAESAISVMAESFV